MADFGELLDKFLAILLAIFEALGPDLISKNINSVDNSFGGFGDVQVTSTATVLMTSFGPPTALVNLSRFPDFSNSVCQSEFCTDYVDPCQDFYQFACGAFLLPQPTRVSDASLNQGSVLRSVTAQLRNRTLSRIRGLLQSPDSAQSQAITKARRIYNACLTSDSVDEEVPVDSLRRILMEVIGGWPLITPNWKASDFDVYQSMAKAKRLGFDTFFQWSVSEKSEDPTGNIIKVGEGVLGLASPDFYNSESGAPIRLAYRELINGVASLLSAGDNSSDHTLDIRDLVDFEKNLANETNFSEKNSKKNSFFFKNFIRQLAPASRFGKEFLNLFKNVLKDVQLDRAVTGDSEMNVENPNFFPLLATRLALEDRLGNDGKTVLANYIGWNIIFTQLPLLGQAYQTLLQTFGASAGLTVVDLTGGLPRWQECVNLVNGAMANAVGSLYVKAFVPPEAKARVKVIIQELRTAALQYVNQTTWLDEMAKTAASDKILALVDYVGYPDYIVNNFTQLDQYYDEVTATESHFENVQSLTRFSLRQQLRKLGQLNERKVDNDAVPVTVNAFYYYDRNVIALLAGLMQSPYFDEEAPDYVNYAGIGYLYAHKLSNVFDEKGSRYNASGFPVAGWSTVTTTAYRTLVNGLRSQYRSSQSPSSMTLDGADVVADNLAIQFVLSAYRANHSIQEAALPKLEQFTPEMRILLSFAQNWCETPESDVAPNSASTYPKSSRVNVALTNLPDFTEIYKCDGKAEMSASRKVSLL